MRLIAATIRNYRLHRETSVRFDAGRTLIGGANESGKSTLIEAIHRGLFLKSRVTGDAQKSMISNRHSGHPEVEVEFQVGDQTYTVAKRFSGQTGTTRLGTGGGAVLHGEEAETRLHQLLQVADVGSGRGVADRAMQQWAHLWVWQGKSGNDPAPDASGEYTAILQRLQAVGGAAVMQSEHDAQVAGHFARLYEQLFTQNGKFKANSDPDQAEKGCAAAETAERDCRERWQRLRQAAEDFEQARQAMAEAEQQIQALRGEQMQIAANLTQAGELENRLEKQQAAADAAAEQATKLQQAEEGIQALRDETGQLQAAVAPLRQQAAQLQQHHAELRSQAAAAFTAYQSAMQQVGDLQQQCDQARRRLSRHDLLARLEKNAAGLEKLQQNQAELQRRQAALHRLPPVDAAALQALRDGQTRLGNASAALQAMAVGIEVLTAASPVRIGDRPVAAGEAVHLTDATDICIGNDTLLRIQPGGGGRLQTAREQVQALAAELAAALQHLGIDSIAAACNVKAERDDLENAIARLQSTIEALDAPALQAEARQLRAELDQLQADIDRHPPSPADPPPPADRDQAQARYEALQHRFQQADAERLAAKAHHETLSTRLQHSEQAAQTAAAALADNDRQIHEKQTRLQLQLQQWGDDDARAQALQQAGAARQQTQSVLEQTRQALATLQPQQLQRNRERIDRAIGQQETALQAARELRAVSQAALTLDGSEDPQAGWVLANARLENARAGYAAEKRKAEAVRLLHRQFQAQQQQLSDRYSKPLAEKITAYLQGLFGPGSRVAIASEDGAFRDIRLLRGNDAELAFDSLSGGTREQVAAAVRLAMAELLAAAHDGSLPVVFDDAFAYSDPERVRILQGMLDLAAERGLQIIVLSCNPADYAGLGARQIRLERPAAAADGMESR